MLLQARREKGENGGFPVHEICRVKRDREWRCDPKNCNRKALMSPFVSQLLCVREYVMLHVIAEWMSQSGMAKSPLEIGGVRACG